MRTTRTTQLLVTGLAALGVVVCVRAAGVVRAEPRSFRPVTDEMLRAPAPGDWLHWRRTLDGTGYSPLSQINKGNVGRLQLAWSWSMMQPGSNQPAPLVYDGVMYLPNPGGVQALDAADGTLLWEFKRPISRRNLAIYDDKIIVTTGDAHVVAVNARTGALVWDSKVADPADKKFSFSSGSIVVNGKVISGMTGCGRYKEDTCYITAHDARTGKELWRTSTVARAGEPGGDSWGETPLAFRAGSEPWMPGSYDPATNLIYWGTAQAKPWASVQRGTGDAPLLYTNSTLALEPDSGKIVWYHQHIPAESHDMDEAFEAVLVDNGSRRSLFKMGKLGILWELDRRSGQFLNAYDLGYQTLGTVDRTKGQVVYRPELVPKVGVEIEYCPGPGGFRNLWSMSFSPETHTFYVPLNMTCVTSTFEPNERVIGGGGNGTVKRTTRHHPASGGHLGLLIAMDSRTGKVGWRRSQPLPYNTASLTTAGGVTFVGNWNRQLYAHDVSTGDVLWQAGLPSAAHGYPITFSAGGRQYVAVAAGPGSSPNVINMLDLYPKKPLPSGAMTLLVFALPESQSGARR